MCWVPSKALARVDLPAPELPTITAVRPGVEIASEGVEAIAGERGQGVDRRAAGERLEPRLPAVARSSQRSALVSRTTGDAPLCQAAAR